MSEENATEDAFTICDMCLGDSAHLKMMKHRDGEECKSCTRPFTVYRWNNNQSSHKAKKTIICTTCARSKSCCQSCMLDINYHIPLHIRDTALKMAGLDKAQLGYDPATSKNREIKAILADKQEATYAKNNDSALDQQQQRAREMLAKLSAKLNERGTTFKKITGGSEAADAKLGNVDVSKVVAKLPFGGSLDTTANPTGTSFFVFGLNDDVPQYLISNVFAQYGKIKSLTVVHRSRCGFVSFATRESAEEFAEAVSANGLNTNKSTAGLLILENKYPLRVAWGKPQPLGTSNEEQAKISVVVAKVMKQLAERDRDFEKGSENKPAKSSRSTAKPSKVTKPAHKSSSKAAAATSYRAARSDFEV